MTSSAKIQTVVVGLDFSDYAPAVISQARALAEFLNAKLVYVHVFETPIVAADKFETIANQMRKLYEAHLRDEHHLHAQDTVVVRHGVAFEEMLKIAQKNPHPLLVVGHRGRTGALGRFFIGSTAERLALQSPFPVWIHRGDSTRLPKNILVPCDLSERAVHTLTRAKQMGLSPGEAEYFHVLQPPVPLLDSETWHLLSRDIIEANAAELKEFENKYGPVHGTESVSRDVSDEIKKRSANFDIVAISPRRHEGFFPSFGSVTSKVVRHVEVPVLVVPAFQASL